PRARAAAADAYRRRILPGAGGARDPRGARARRALGRASGVPDQALVRRTAEGEGMTTTTTTMLTTAAPPIPDIASAAFKSDPVPACARLRTEQAVVRMAVPFAEGHAFVVTRYAEAAAVLRDERFVKNVRTARDPGDLRLPWAPRSLRPLQNSMLDVDGADHRRLRSLVQETFSPRYMAQLEPRIESLTAELLDRLDGETDVDLVA